MNFFQKTRMLPQSIALAAAIATAGCAQMPAGPSDAAHARTYVLVHGAFENQAIWNSVRQGLQQAGQQVIAIDLPGRDGDATPVDGLSLDRYRDTVQERIATLSQPVILVGHSFGGITISNVAEQHPERVRTLVFLAALLPRDGDSARALSRQDPDTHLTREAVVVSPDHRWASVRDTGQLALFCADCSPDQARTFQGSLIPEPAGPLGAAVHLSSARYGQVDKVYIATDADQVVSPSAQRAMLAATPTRMVVHLASSHSPFLSHSAELVQALLDIDQ